MSAYFVDHATIDAIASLAIAKDPSLSFAKVQRDLIAENKLSLDYRYPSYIEANDLDALAIASRLASEPLASLPENAELYRMLCEYDYQTCEHPEYKDSGIYRLIAKLQDAIKADIELLANRSRLESLFADSVESPLESLNKSQRFLGLALLYCLASVTADDPMGNQFQITAAKIATVVSESEINKAREHAANMAASLQACVKAAT